MGSCLRSCVATAAAQEADAEPDNCIDAPGRAFNGRAVAFAAAASFRQVAVAVAELQAAIVEDQQ